jgi:Polyketide cyclase / dehydrase and lipid transport
MAIRPFRSERRGGPRPLSESRRVERRVFVNAPPRAVWLALHDPSNVRALFPELTLGPAEPAWPAASAVRRGNARLGLLRDDATVESLEARPLTSFRLRVTGRAFVSDWCWSLEARAGGTRVVHDAALEPGDWIAAWLIRLGRDSVAERVETHLRALKEVAEAAWTADRQVRQGSRLA